MAAAIAELPEIYRAPVVLRDIEGLSTEEASSRLQVKDQTLKSRLHRGRVMLREQLEVFTQRPRTPSPDAGLLANGVVTPNVGVSYRCTNSAGRAFGEAGGKLECECRDPLGSRRVDLFPVVGRTMVIARGSR